MPSNDLDERRDKDEKSDYKIDFKEYSNEYSLEETLNMIGFGITHLEVLIVCGLFLQTVINETMGMSIVTIASQCDFEIGPQEKAILSASAFLGILVASYPFGYFSDAYGRKPIILGSITCGIATSFSSSFMTNFWIFVLLRFLSGVGYAGASTTIYAYLGEFNTMSNRPLVINYASMFVGLSSVYTTSKFL